MAILNISQFAGPVSLSGSVTIPAVALPALSVENLTFSTSTASTALRSDCGLVRLMADADCHLAIGASPTATTAGIKLAAGVPEIFAINASAGTIKIAAISA